MEAPISTERRTLTTTADYKPKGRLDGSTAAAHEKSIQELLAGEVNSIAINLSELDYLSSAGLRGIIVAAKLLQTAGAEMMLCESREQVRQVLALSFRSLLRNYESEAEALAAFSR